MTCLDDATVLGLVEGRLPPATLAEVDEHIDSCASCRDVVSLVATARSPGRTLAPGDKLGRFVIGELRGTGAMGRVYAAFEPELDRHVAIKVLIEDGSGARDRLVREAQAMARLNHPNVVTVHEVGTTDAGVYVAMELVEGDSLRVWVDEPRPWREIVGVLVEIARGLGAVHAAGVVHRDVKPDNMIVGTDGRVRLGDFGLARSGDRVDGPSLAVGTDTTVAGTPAYMAPEVLRGGAASAASDQFSFGVMAYELLAGRRPFAGATWAELLASIERADIASLDVPGWLDAIIRRCLAVDPAARFASMREIADALERGAGRKRPTAWIAAALATAVLASGATWMATRTDPASAPALACALADLELNVPAGATPATTNALQKWTTAWREERAAACRAPEPRRDRCLDQRRVELTALLASVDSRGPRAHAKSAGTPDTRMAWGARTPPSHGPAIDGTPASRGSADERRGPALGAPPSGDARESAGGSASAVDLFDLVSGLAPPSECRLASADGADPLPLDPSQATVAREIASELATTRAAIALGERASASTTALVARARSTSHAPTIAEALLVRAEALRAEDRLADAVAAAREATAAATRGRADLVAARAWLARVAIAGEQRDLDSAEDVGALALAAVERIGSPPHMVATLARLRGLIAYNRGQLDEARRLLREAHAALAARSPERATIESALGSVERQAGNLDDAERWHRSALALDLELRGEKHRDVARDHHNIAGVLRLRDQLDDALVEYRKALAIELDVQGERSIAAGLTHNSIGLVLLAKKDYGGAATELTQARDILTAAGHGDRAFAEHNLGLLAQAQGKHRDALAHFDAAAAIYKTTIGEGASAAQRLPADRQTSVAALRPAKRPAPNPAKPAKPTEPPKKQDVGVYGSGQTW